MRAPVVSVIIPTYNRARFLTAAVQSIAAQTFTDYEVLIADDGSTDDTSEVITKLPITVRYLRFPHRGKSAVLNSALKEVRGEWFAVLDSDDLWLPQKLERQFEAIERFGHCQFCFTDVILRGYCPGDPSAFTQSGKRFDGLLCCISQPIEYVLKTPHDIFIQASIIKSDLLHRLGGFNEALIAEDTDIIFRVSLETELAVVNEPLVIVDRMPASRPGSIMGQIKGSRQVDLRYRQAMYEGWLLLGSKLPRQTELQVRKRLAKVHDAWANWHLDQNQPEKACEDLQNALRVHYSLPRSLKSIGMRLWPSGIAGVMQQRAKLRRLIKKPSL